MNRLCVVDIKTCFNSLLHNKLELVFFDDTLKALPNASPLYPFCDIDGKD